MRGEDIIVWFKADEMRHVMEHTMQQSEWLDIHGDSASKPELFIFSDAPGEATMTGNTPTPHPFALAADPDGAIEESYVERIDIFWLGDMIKDYPDAAEYGFSFVKGEIHLWGKEDNEVTHE